MSRTEILEYVNKTYKVQPDYPWMKFPDHAVLRHVDTAKWFALIINIPKNKLGLEGKESVDIINVKCDPILIGGLRMKEGYLPAYHMNKESWITILLDGSVPLDEVCGLIDLSYKLTRKHKV